jgi:L-aspartate oxidase
MRIDTDVLIIGAGLGGLMAALHARGRQVTVIAAEPAGESFAASDLAQGGIAAAVATGDSPERHLQDTLRAGGTCVNRAAARILCAQAPAAIVELESLGVPFARSHDAFALHTEAAHSCARVLHVDDCSGAAIMRHVRAAVFAAPGIEVMTSVQAHKLLRDGRGVCGVQAMSPRGPLAISANAVVIATGGIGGLFEYSTNPLTACGDGIAMAVAAGARSRDLEFVQFHPTALDVAQRPLPLLTEALRGAGAVLVDENGDSIVKSARGNLEPRDVVARAVYSAQQQGRRVLLDATSCDVAAFPSIQNRCRQHGYDLSRAPVPITPAVHYFMGGIATDINGRTSLHGLFAVGEAACTGVHGANRLASNSLLEAVVFGRRLGEALTREPQPRARHRAIHIEDLAPMHDADVAELRTTMWRCMGVVRDREGLRQGIDVVNALRSRTPNRFALAHARVRLAHSMLTAALMRTRSCGAHFRRDDIADTSLLHAG